MVNQRLQQQMAFIIEIDKLKNILRRTRLVSSDRYENSAEHSWHLAMMAVILLEHANDPELDLLKVMKMHMIHDIVEIDAGDTFVYDAKGQESKRAREEEAAERIFGLLPQDQKNECLALWNEFEERATSEAKYAAALDRLQPLLFNFYNEGATWKEHGITSEQVFSHNQHISEGSERLWHIAKGVIEESIKNGYLKK